MNAFLSGPTVCLGSVIYLMAKKRLLVSYQMPYFEKKNLMLFS